MIENIKKRSDNSKTLKIGIIGHRVIKDENLIRDKLQKVLGVLSDASPTGSSFIVLSPLAEGSDRLVAEEILTFEDNMGENKLIAVLPMKKEDYMTDFKSAESREEFLELLDQAEEVITFPQTSKREYAYLQVGEYVARECDILLAIWDGLPSRGKGGTAEIVNYAENIGREVVWINSVSGKIRLKC